MRQRLEPLGLLEQLELQEAQAQQALLDHKALLVLPESLADRDQRGQPELLALMVLQELLA
jgi:hypothetical protein